ncbi:MAG: glycosyltransferase family 39 protein, partial [Victivallaceae bacterium]
TYRYSYGYTVFLTILNFLGGGNLLAMRIFHAMVSALVPVMIYRAGRLIFRDRLAAWLGALCYLFYAPALLISLDFLREAPLALAFIAYFIDLVRALRSRKQKYFLRAGLWGALTILGRENFAAVIFVPLLFLFFNRIRQRLPRRAVVIFIAAALLPVLAVMTFNYCRFGSFQPVPGNAGNIMQFYHGESATRHFGTAVLSLLKRAPGQFCDFFSNYELANSLSVYAHRELIGFLNVFNMPYHLMLLLALTGKFYYFRNRGVQLAALLIAAYIASILFFTMFYRFRIPVAPLIAMLAGGGIAALLAMARRRQYRGLAIFAFAGSLFLWVTAADPDHKRPFAERAAVARIMIEHRQFDRAESYLQKMAADGHDVRAGFTLLERRRLQP